MVIRVKRGEAYVESTKNGFRWQDAFAAEVLPANEYTDEFGG